MSIFINVSMNLYTPMCELTFVLIFDMYKYHTCI